MPRHATKDQMAGFLDRYLRGESVERLARELGVCTHTMRKYLRQFEKGVVREWQE